MEEEEGVWKCAWNGLGTKCRREDWGEWERVKRRGGVLRQSMPGKKGLRREWTMTKNDGDERGRGWMRRQRLKGVGPWVGGERERKMGHLLGGG